MIFQYIVKKLDKGGEIMKRSLYEIVALIKTKKSFSNIPSKEKFWISSSNSEIEEALKDLKNFLNDCRDIEKYEILEIRKIPETITI